MLLKCVMAAALAVGMTSTPALAQVTPGPQPGTPPQPMAPTPLEEQPLHTWYVTGFVGSAFGAQADEANVNLGGALGYQWRRAIGVEFAADFSPNFTVGDLLEAGESTVNSYMVNAVGALPIGDINTVQPFVTAGLGALTIRSDDQVINGTSVLGISDNQFAVNVGGGLMAFRDRWGFRGDVRYFRGFADVDTGIAPNQQFQLDGVDFWRANVGVAYRW